MRATYNIIFGLDHYVNDENDIYKVGDKVIVKSQDGTEHKDGVILYCYNNSIRVRYAFTKIPCNYKEKNIYREQFSEIIKKKSKNIPRK